MSFEKRNYISEQTVITVKNLNEIQDAIIALESNGGVTPHIGENGNWYIGNTDTGVKAAGTDYVLTSADKSEIAALVLAEIPNGDEVAYG